MNRPRLLVFSAVLLAGCQAATEHATLHHGAPAHPGGHAAPAEPVIPPARTTAVDLRNVTDLEGIVPELARQRVVFVGERHDRLEHHLNQLEIVRQLHALDPDLAIGMEMFQAPYQSHLDAFVDGRLDENDLLRRTEYFDRWGFDYRLYRPILEFARENRIPVVALNAPRELVRAVSEHGYAGLSEADRSRLPDTIDRSDEAYRERLRAVWAQHQGSGDFERFEEVQLLWDEFMAERAAEYLKEHPGRRLVILAGNGHLAYGAGIPARVQRRAGLPMAVVLNGSESEMRHGVADFLLLPAGRALPPPGRLGLVLDTADDRVTISSFSTGGASEGSGMREGDHILALDGAAVSDISDVRLAMWDKRPGDTVQVRIERPGAPADQPALSFDVTLR